MKSKIREVAMVSTVTALIEIEVKNMPLWCRFGTLLMIPYQVLRFLYTGKASIGKWKVKG